MGDEMSDEDSLLQYVSTHTLRDLVEEDAVEHFKRCDENRDHLCILAHDYDRVLECLTKIFPGRFSIVQSLWSREEIQKYDSYINALPDEIVVSSGGGIGTDLQIIRTVTVNKLTEQVEKLQFQVPESLLTISVTQQNAS